MSDYSRCARPREDVRAYRPCTFCGAPILSAETVQGGIVHLDVLTPCYGIAWADHAAVPTACESPAYALHTCPTQGTGTRQGERQKRPRRRLSLGTGEETEFSTDQWQRMSDAFRRMLERQGG